MPNLTFVNAWHRSRYGKIVSDWKVAGHAFTWHVTVPANCTATLYIPAADAGAVTENGGLVDSRQQEALHKGRFVMHIGSGTYAITSLLKS